MKQVKNIKLTLIITLVLLLSSIVSTYFIKYINTNYCLGKVAKIPFDTCMNMKLEVSFVPTLYTLFAIAILILFIKSISYWIIKLTNK